MTNFSGAFDLSKLQRNTQPQAGNSGHSLVKADEQTLREHLQLSEKTPVLMMISDASQDSETVRKMLEKAILASEGQFAGIEVDISSSPQLAAAVGVQQAPAVVAVLAGQPAPLFQGVPSSEQLLQVLAQVIQLAQQNGITERVSSTQKKQEPALSPAHQEAIAAIEAGNLDDAKSKYEKILVEYPNDKDAQAGLNQVKLMIRLQNPPKDDLEKELSGADQLFISGNPSGAFSLLLDMYATSENQQGIRERLLELFSLIGESDPDVLAARRRLASLMF